MMVYGFPDKCLKLQSGSDQSGAGRGGLAFTH